MRVNCINKMNTLRKMGKFFGYPQCCIDWFVEERASKFTPLTTDQEKAIDNRGFIPCPECAKKVNNSFPLSNLIINRICNKPYPEHNDVQMEEYFEKEHNLIKS